MNNSDFFPRIKRPLFFSISYYIWERSVVDTVLAPHASTPGSIPVGCEFSQRLHYFFFLTKLRANSTTNSFGQLRRLCPKSFAFEKRRTSLGKGVYALPKDVRLCEEAYSFGQRWYCSAQRRTAMSKDVQL